MQNRRIGNVYLIPWCFPAHSMSVIPWRPHRLYTVSCVLLLKLNVWKREMVDKTSYNGNNLDFIVQILVT